MRFRVIPDLGRVSGLARYHMGKVEIFSLRKKKVFRMIANP